MAIISILIALAADRFLVHLESLRRPGLIHRYQRALAGRLGNWRYWDGPWGVLVVAGVPLLVLALALGLLNMVAFGLFGALLSIAVLYLSLGPRDLTRQVRDYLRLTTESPQAALGVAAEMVDGERPGSAAKAHAVVRDGVFDNANRRLFGVLLWFMLLGPLGALLFRMADEIRPAGDSGEESGFSGAANRLYGILAWPPARLLALTYGLVGSFEDALAQWRSHYEESGDGLLQGNRQTLVHAGRGAIRLDPDCPETSDNAECVAAALDLYHRAVAVWLILLAVFTLAGWLA